MPIFDKTDFVYFFVIIFLIVFNCLMDIYIESLYLYTIFKFFDLKNKLSNQHIIFKMSFKYFILKMYYIYLLI